MSLVLGIVLSAGGVASAKSALRPPDGVRTSLKGSSVVLRWRDNAKGELRYEVRSRVGPPATTKRLRANATRYSAVFPPATRVSFRVRACGRRSCSGWSRSVAARTPSAKPLPGGPPGAGGQPTVGSCSVFPADNPFNRDVSSLPVDPRSDDYIRSIGADGFLHPDFGGGGQYGIPFEVVPSDQREVPITFTAYGDESDPGPYPIPPNARVEGGSDRHVLVVAQGECKLYELYVAQRSGEGWSADSGAVFDLRSNAVRPKGWTSADAAGLPILPGLARYDEVAAGAVMHALRFTVQRTQRGFIFPARHFASSSDDQSLPPMGLRLRLKASYDVTRFRGQARVILEGLKRYGMIVADNGSDWYITGGSDPRWDDEDLNQLKTVPGSAFEAVQTGSIER